MRGTDSTGIFQVTRDREINWLKHAVSATAFLEETAARAACNRAPSMKVNVGHVRAATSGAVTTDNAHPFEAERKDGTKIIGVHNGSLLTGWKDKPGAKDFTVDSAWIMHMLATEGADAFEHFNGAFALIWYDTREPDHIFMARNKDRPLCYMISEDSKSMLGCSELGMLVWLAGRNGFKVAKEGAYNTPFYLVDGKIYKFSLKNMGEFEKYDFPDYKYVATPSVAPRPYIPANYRNYDRSTDLTHWNNRLNDEFSEYDEDGLPWFNPVATPHYTRKEDTYQFNIQEDIIQKVKDELAEARYSLVSPTQAGSSPAKKDLAVLDGEYTVVDEDALDRALHKAIAKMQTEDEPATPLVTQQALDLDSISILSANTSSATSGEIASAKEMNLFGKVVEFSGIDYDETFSSCLGYFTIKNPDTGEAIQCDGEIRYIPQKVARELYIERASHIAIIVGWHKSQDWAICAVPDAEQKAFIYGARVESLSRTKAN